MKQLSAKITANEKIGASFYKMSLESGYLAKNAQPGQFVEIRCTKGIDPLLRRPLGVHRVTRTGIEVFYEVVGKGTKLLSEKNPGYELSLIGPLGNGFDLELASDVNVLVAGGIGVAPLLELAVQLAGLPVGRLASLEVFIGACKKEHLLCEKEFRELGATVNIATDDGSKGYKGFVTELLKQKLFNRQTGKQANRQTCIYACGPAGMLGAVSRIAREHSIPCQVSFEERMACGVGVCLGCPVKVRGGEYKMVCKDGPVFNSEEIAWQ